MHDMTLAEIERGLMQGSLDHMIALEKLLEMVDNELRWIEGTGKYDLPPVLNFVIKAHGPAIGNLLSNIRQFNDAN